MGLSLILRSLLDSGLGYRLFTKLMPGACSARTRFVKTFVQPKEGDRVLDIGCGPGDILLHFPSCEYLGVDMNEGYIEQASKTYGDRGVFLCRRADEQAVTNTSYFDIVIAMGLLHHLDDSEARGFLEMTRRVLKPSGRLVTLDGVYWDGQSRLERFVMSKDRGKHIRTREQYVALAAKSFSKVKDFVEHGLIGIPYSHIILTCSQ